MFIKAITKRNRVSHKSYTYHRLLESYRSSRGPRHEILLNLGRLDLPKDQWKSLADRIEAILNGQRELSPVSERVEALAHHYASLLKQRRASQGVGPTDLPAAPEPILRTVDLRSVRTKGVRTVGGEHIGVEYARRLGLERAFVQAGLSEDEARVGLLLTIGRLVAPGSELSTLGWVRHHSGLSELIGSWAKGVSLSGFYRATDALYEYRQGIEEQLVGEERKLFGLEEKVILYDLTNTYFEGSKYDGAEISYGKSKDRRSDCPLMTVGLVVDEWGMAKRSGIFPGNVSEPSTMEAMVKELGTPAGSTVVMDGGIGKKENLKRLREAGYHYITVSRGRSRRESVRDDEGMVVIKADGEQLVRGQLVKSGDEWLLRCRSEQRRAKEQGMKERFQKRFEEGLAAMAAGLGKKGTTKSYEKILQRIGRLKERSHGIHQYYDIEITQHEGTVRALRWSLARAEEAEKRYSGEYILRTSRHDLDEQSLWQLYITLEGIEDSFRALKSELGLRPVFHFKEQRIKAHLFVSVLAYHLLSAIRHRLRSQGYLMRWATVRQRMSTHVLSTVSMKTDSGAAVSIRTPSSPEVFHRDIYRALGLRMNPIPARRAERQKV